MKRLLLLLLTAWSLHGAEVRYRTEPEKIFVGQMYDFLLEIDVPKGSGVQNIQIVNEPFVSGKSFAPVAKKTIGEVDRIGFVCCIKAETPGSTKLAGTLIGQLVHQRRVLGMMNMWNSESIQAEIKPFELVIRPMPMKECPVGYSGAIGTFTVSGSLKPQTARPGDLVTLSVSVKGTGTLPDKLVLLPTMSTNLFKVYPPKQTVNTATEKAYEQVVIPLTEKSDLIPAVEFSYFDSAAEIYRKTSAGPFVLKWDTSARNEKEETVQVLGGTDGQLQTRAAAEARLAPSELSAVLFTLPAGSPVQILETADGWNRIDWRGKRGWIRSK